MSQHAERLGEEFVLRQSRPHSGLAQLFAALFALLTLFAPPADARLPDPSSGNAGPAAFDPQRDAAGLACVYYSAAGEIEGEPDEEEEAILAWRATPRGRAAASYPTAVASTSSCPRLSAYWGTGPPYL